MFQDNGKVAIYVRDAMISIAFFQIFLTPYLFFWLHLGWAGYGRWCLINLLISSLAGPLIARLYRWIT